MLLRCPNCKRVINDNDKVATIYNTVNKQKGVVCPNTACKVEIWFKKEPAKNV